MPADAPLQTTPLDALHRGLGAKMVPFAGYDMPVQYPAGILAEHGWTRGHAGLFDVSHMGQVRLRGATAAAALERLVPSDIVGLKPQRTRYTLFTNDQGGILDDLMVTNAGDHLFLVVNAACKVADIAHLQAKIGADCAVEPLPDRALLALQGPEAAAALAQHAPETATLGFMSFATVSVAGVPCFVTRSGYTGEDGFEISVPNDAAERLARLLLADPRVKPIGLGARDSLRLEAGLCLYGHDIDTTTTPIEADLAWTIQKRRREAGGFPGAAVILKQLAAGAPRKRVGLKPDGKAPAREHTAVTAPDGAAIGEVTSGGFGPTVGGPVAMGYVGARHAAPGSAVNLIVRDQPRPAVVAPLPFTPHRYHRS
ncbi:MAG: glycine cleavage system aminomethyltransferase GcvT [Proteobacteria bacterium]|nr:glycine cleavage system aminomethyltransferase GcvT [Pseudomonadota bacterium]